MKRFVPSYRSRSGLTGGWLLAVLAVLAVVVILVLFVWRPGSAPPTPAPAPAGPTEEAPADGAEAPLEEEPAAEEPPTAEEPADAEAEEPAAQEESAGQPAEAEEAPAEAEPEGPTSEAAAAPGPVDATVDEEPDVVLQADVQNREADFGGAVAEATNRTASAIEEVEASLEGIEPATVVEEAPPEDLAPASAEGAEQASPRVRQVDLSYPDLGAAGAGAAMSAGAASASVRTTPEGEEADVRLQQETTPDEEEPRVGSASVEERSESLERARSAVTDVERVTRPPQRSAAPQAEQDLASGQEDAGGEELRVRTVDLQDRTSAVERARNASDDAERITRPERTDVTPEVIADQEAAPEAEAAAESEAPRVLNVDAPSPQTVRERMNVEMRRTFERTDENGQESDTR